MSTVIVAATPLSSIVLGDVALASVLTTATPLASVVVKDIAF